MSTNIFGDEAPKYWARGLPVIPLRHKDKRPVIAGWSRYCDIMPTQKDQADWVDTYFDGNIGLPLGKASGLVAVDIDTDDPTVLRVLDEILPPSPWERVGRKGKVRIYRYNGERYFQIKDGQNRMLVELLVHGKQVVLPPSIHPDTQLPYRENVPLLDVCAVAPLLPRNLETIIRSALRDAGVELMVGGGLGLAKVSSFVPAGSRDNAVTQHAGILARAVTRGERTLLEALGEITHYVTDFTEQVAGDVVSVEKAQERLLQFLIRDVTGEKARLLPPGWDAGLSAEQKKELGLDFTEDNERWSAEKTTEYLKAKFAQFEANTSGWINAVDIALSKIARADLNPMEEERLLKFIASNSTTGSVATGIPIALFRRRLATLRKGELRGENHKQIAEQVFKDLCEYGEVRHVEEWQSFWQWRGASWERLQASDILKHIVEEYGNMDAAKRASDHSGILKTVRSLANEPLQVMPVKGLNFANGFVDEHLKLQNHHPDFGCTYVLPYRYVPEDAGNMPLFMQFLRDCWGQDPDYEDKLAALQEALGATMFGLATYYQRAICLFGLPRTGKTTLMEIVKGLMPPGCVCSVPPTEWGARFALSQLRGKLLNLAGELSEHKFIEGAEFKLIVEGAEISVEEKGLPHYQMRPIAAHWFATNHLPKTKDSSDGFNRRWLFLEFQNQVELSHRVEGLHEIILANEREAIAAWAAAGVARLRENHDYTIPNTHTALVDTMSSSNNSVRFFLTSSSKLRIGRAAHVGRSETRIIEDQLYAAYSSFSGSALRAKGVGRKIFRDRMLELQKAFDFNMHLKKTNQGQELVEYEFITLVDLKK